MRTSLSRLLVILLILLPGSLFSQKHLPFQVQEVSHRMQMQKTEADSVALVQQLPIRVERPDGTIFELMRIERGIPRYYITENLNAAKTISSNKLWSGAGFGYALSGLGVLLGEWDGGKVLTTHQELTGRVTAADLASLSAHSTHVAGTMIATGVNAAAHGMANQATLISHEWTNDVIEMNNEAIAGLKTSNHSYGLITGWTFNYFNDNKWVWFGDSSVSETEDYGFGFYNSEAENWDGVAETNPNYLICKAAGNDRNEGPSGAVLHWFFKNGVQTLSSKARSRDGRLGGYDCINGAGVGKNILTVGAIDDMTGGYVNPAGVIMSSFSSWGPTDDGRIKPDICGNGVGLTSSVETANNAYGVFSGTSMATPNVTGSIGLLLQLQQNLHGSTPLRSSTMKAIIVNTADEAGPSTGPDYVYGWGVMNTLHAAQLMTLDSAQGSGSHIREIVLNQGTSVQFDISSDGTQPLKATIAWVDPAHTALPASLNPTTLLLINDLDVRIIKKKDLTTYQPWILDPTNPTAAATTGDNFRDNVEQVYIASPERAVYTVRVTHKGSLSGGAQNFSIVMSGNVPSIGPIVTTTPSSVTLSLLPGGVKLDSIRVANTGDTTLNYHLAYDTTLSWISLAEDSGSVAPLDSAYFHYTINAAGLTQWTTFSTNVTLSGAASPVILPFTLHTLGPKIGTSPSYVVVDVDSGAVGADTITIHNTGFSPLAYVMKDNAGNFPVWMTVNDTDGTIPPGDSARAIMTFNAVSQPVGDYTTLVTVASNDTSTGPVVTQVDLHVGTRMPFGVNVHSRWNIVSLPVRPFTFLKTSLYPTASSPAWSFNGAMYVQKDTLKNRSGYWMKFPSAQIVTIDGYTFTSDTIPVASGWNMVGAVSDPVATASVSTVPLGILSSPFFEYTTGFAIADSLRPGKGYFVHANASGSVLMHAGPSALPKQSARSMFDGLNTITLEDGAKNGQTLYFGEAGAAGRAVTMMPPAPPAGSFDARFASGMMVETVSPASEAHSLVVRVTPVDNPVIVRWNILGADKRRYTITDEAGSPVDMAPNGRLTLSGSGAGERTLTISYSDPVLPKEFALQQNYPNPFNPSTTISYELPVAGFVTIKIYNILGNEVASVVNGTQEAGFHSAVFDASALPSGVYIYKMQSERFTAVKKMMLMR